MMKAKVKTRRKKQQQRQLQNVAELVHITILTARAVVAAMGAAAAAATAAAAAAATTVIVAATTAIRATIAIVTVTPPAVVQVVRAWKTAHVLFRRRNRRRSTRTKGGSRRSRTSFTMLSLRQSSAVRWAKVLRMKTATMKNQEMEKGVRAEQTTSGRHPSLPSMR